MSSSVPFGRRAPAGVARRPAARAPLDPALSLNAEAFRATLAGQARGPSEFERWRRRQGRDVWGLRLLRLALAIPGVVGVGVRAPWSVSLLLELAGLGVAILLTRARRRRLAALAAWTPSEP